LNQIPGGDPKAAHEVLAELYGAISGNGEQLLLGDLEIWPGQEHRNFKSLFSARNGHRVVPPGATETDIFFRKAEVPASPKEGLELLLTHRTFGTEELSAYAHPARMGEKAPKLMMHPEDARRLNLADQDRIGLSLDRGEVIGELKITSNMARGVMILPRHRGLHWQKVKEWPVVVPDDGIQKLEIDK
jgi:NADH-quinone oxidoreductase subunit G